jgi:fatty acid synthase subunit alpha, fungi type
VPARFLVHSTFRRSRMTLSNSGTQPEISQEQKNRIKAFTLASSVRYARHLTTSRAPVSPVAIVHLKCHVGTQWEYSSNLTGIYLDLLHEIVTSRTTFKNTLITGIGKGSRSSRAFSGDTHVVITTSRFSRATADSGYYQAIFQRLGSRGFARTIYQCCAGR